MQRSHHTRKSLWNLVIGKSCSSMGVLSKGIPSCKKYKISRCQKRWWAHTFVVNFWAFNPALRRKNVCHTFDSNVLGALIVLWPFNTQSWYFAFRSETESRLMVRGENILTKVLRKFLLTHCATEYNLGHCLPFQSGSHTCTMHKVVLTQFVFIWIYKRSTKTWSP